MEWVSRRRIGLAAGLSTAAGCLAAICSFAPQDPTFTNLRFPKDGIANWLGYPGALAGGSLVELFGWAALLLPPAVAYWTLCPLGRPRGWRYALHTAELMLLGAAWAGQWSTDPGLGLASPGLAGWSGGQWMRDTLGPWLAGILLTAGLAFAVWHQLYAPGFRAALRDLRAVARIFTRDGRIQAREWLRTRAEGAAALRSGALTTVALVPLQAIGVLTIGIGQGVRRGIVAPVRAVVDRVRGSAASLAAIKARTASAPLPARWPGARRAPEPARDAAAFDGWLEDDRIVPAQEPRMAEAAERRSGTLADFENTTWRNPADEPLYDSRPGASAPDPAGDILRARAPSGAERLAEASPTARELQADVLPQRQPDPAQHPARQRVPGLPPAGAGKERWEQLLQRYRENLDLDWDEQSWRGKDEQLDGAPESGQGPARRTPK